VQNRCRYYSSVSSSHDNSSASITELQN